VIILTGSINMPLSIKPSDTDFISSIISGVVGLATNKTTFTRGTIIQFVTVLTAKLISSNTNAFNRPENELLQEVDLWTSVIRALVSSAQKEDIKQVTVDTLTGSASNILARLLTSETKIQFT
jgi:hypothetical protein